MARTGATAAAAAMKVPSSAVVRLLVFAVNGRRFELTGIDPSMTLLEFLRTRTPFKGAKLGCGEGGCGACVVLLSTYDPIHNEVKEHAVSSCLTLLYSINFCSITTTEGLGNTKDGFHSIHQRFSGFHASQCGFCTPGMCMSLFSALTNADKNRRLESPDGFSKLRISEAEKAVSGNLCRCTGYRPIIDVCKSFAADVDLEDLGLNVFWRKQDKNATVGQLPPYKQGSVCTFPEFMKSEIRAFLDSSYKSKTETLSGPAIVNSCNSNGCNSNGINHADLADVHWYYPGSIEELYELLDLEESRGEGRVKVVVGNTSTGVYKELDLYDTYIDLRGIPELSVVKIDSHGIEIGAAVSITKAIEVLREEGNDMDVLNGSSIFTKLADHMSKVASHFVRNTASLGGNLIIAQQNQFPSDIATIFLAVGSTVCIQRPSKRVHLSFEDFFKENLRKNRDILLSIHIPRWGATSTLSSETNGCKLLFETYRAAPRPLGNAVSYLNCAFLAQVSLNQLSGEPVLDNLCLAFGAYGCKHAIRARKVEEYLVGKSVNALVLLEAIRLLKETILPAEGVLHSAYRSSLAVAFIFKFLQPLAIGVTGPLDDLSMDSHGRSIDIGCLNDNLTGELNGPIVNSSSSVGINQLKNGDMLLSSKQDLEYGSAYDPVGAPTKKTAAEIQASGEAVYVDDIPAPEGCLYGSFIYSTMASARVKGIEFSSSILDKIFTVISVNDIPVGGENIGSTAMFGDEPLFANGVTTYAGQPVGIVIAESQRFANMAARQAILKYDTENLDPPILTVEEAVRRSSFFQVPPPLCPKQVGDYSHGMSEADHKILSAELILGSQYYFYMETQTALAVPDEDNCMAVYSSTQCPDTSQLVIAKCLGLPHHNVRVITRRVGGGFGGKALKSMPIAAACSLAAYKLQRPVRMYVDRQTDMVVIAGRHPMKITYSVGFKADGKITALHIELLINAGISEDVSPMLPHTITGALKKYNWGAFSSNVKVCKTNLSSKSAMRAPGELQGSYIAEAIIEHVASVLIMDADSIRRMNLHTSTSLTMFYEDVVREPSGYTLPSIFSEMTSPSNYKCTLQAIQDFNDHNKWRKRGVSCVPIIYMVTLRPTPGRVGILNDGSIVVEVGGVEIGQGLWTKVKQMTAFALGQLWPDGGQNLLDRVRVLQNDTLSLIQGGWTAGSTTSESSCEAVRIACSILVDRLKVLKDSLEHQMGAISWNDLILQAYLRNVNLSASSYWVPESGSERYLNYGVCVSEVEVDLLTGATIILRSDLVYDCGQSLNPAVDMGQIEGSFVQGIGFFMYEEYLTNSEGLTTSDGTWTYKIPTVDTIPRQFNVKLLNSGHHQKRVLSSKASGEPPLLLAASVHCAVRAAIKAAWEEFPSSSGDGDVPKFVKLEVPATMPVVKEVCGLDIVERYLEALVSTRNPIMP